MLSYLSKTFSRILHQPKILFSYILSYLLVLLVPIGCSVIILITTRQAAQRNIREQLLQANQTVLQQVRDTVGSALDNSVNLCFDISNRDKILNILYIRQPFTVQQRIDIKDAVSGEMQSSTSWQLIDSYSIYFSYGDFLLSGSGKYTPTLAYDTYFSDSGLSYDSWYNLVKSWQSGQFINATNTIYYVRTIPYASRLPVANVVIAVKKSDLLSDIEQIGWINDGLLFVFDKNNSLIMSNSDTATYTGITFGRNSSAKVNGKTTLYSSLTDQNGWKYVLVMNGSHISVDTMGLKNLSVYYILIALLLGFWLALTFSRKNYLPIKEILKLFQSHQTAPATGNTGDELTLIGSAVQKMIYANTDMLRQIRMKNEQICQNYLSRLITGKTSLATVTEKQLEENFISFPYENFILLLFRIKNYTGYFDDAPDDVDAPIDLMYYSLLYLIREIINEKYCGYVCEIDGMIACAVNMDGESDRDTFSAFLRELENTVEKGLYVTIVACVSNMHKSVIGIQRAYEEANAAMQSSLWSDCDETLYYASLRTDNEFGYSQEMDQALTNQLMSGNIKKVKETLAEIFHICFESNSSPRLFHCCANNIAVTMIRAAENLNGRSEQLAPEKIAESILSLDSVDTMGKYLLETAQQICDLVNSGKESHNSLLLNGILNYIAHNFSDRNLNNTMIADAMRITPAYLSRFFKQQTGIGVSTYISKLRIEKAKTIILDKKKGSFNDLCVNVGFENVATFIRAFKKYEGVTPGKYLETLQTRTVVS